MITHVPGPFERLVKRFKVRVGEWFDARLAEQAAAPVAVSTTKLAPAPKLAMTDERSTLDALRAISVDGKVRDTQRSMADRTGRSTAAISRALQHAKDTKAARVRSSSGRGGVTEIEFLN